MLSTRVQGLDRGAGVSSITVRDKPLFTQGVGKMQRYTMKIDEFQKLSRRNMCNHRTARRRLPNKIPATRQAFASTPGWRYWRGRSAAERPSMGSSYLSIPRRNVYVSYFTAGCSLLLLRARTVSSIFQSEATNRLMPYHAEMPHCCKSIQNSETPQEFP